MNNKFAVFAIALAFIALFATPAFAVEGGLGRPISGATINPYAGLVPPAPGFALSIGEEYYSGSISGAKTVPVEQSHYARHRFEGLLHSHFPLIHMEYAINRLHHSRH